MNKIHQLSDFIISKIAAGEVIERPVYAVKELIEISLDAGADFITLQIEESGLKRITIIDNGEGMSKEDLEESIKPHTTSKIDSDHSLLGIKTLGFRGEALSSIAAISDMTIKSRTKDTPEGRMIQVEAGQLVSQTAVGMPVGTEITISNLFYPVPARKKFLKAGPAEYRRILELVMQYALSLPSVRFLFSHNGKLVLDLPITDSLDERIHSIMGDSFIQNAFPLTHSDSYFTVKGFLAHPQITTTSLQKQLLFVNNRSVSDKLITQAVREAYGGMIPQGNFPVWILFLSIPYETVDVNVHPRKEQISLIHSETVFTGIKEAITELLLSQNLTFQSLRWKGGVLGETILRKDMFSPRAAKTKSHTGNLLKKTVMEREMLGNMNPLKEILQMHDTYLFMETDYGIMIIDQHAAHERILYEKFLEEFHKKSNEKKKSILKDPVHLEVTAIEYTVIQSNLEFFYDLGFTLEEFGTNSFILRSVPYLFKDHDYKKLITEMIEDIDTGKNNTIDTQTKRMLTYLSCRAAVQAGDKITEKEAKDLVKKLENCPNNATCPHGRPTRIEISLKDLNKNFKRG